MISVLSMQDGSNKDVTEFYMNIIYEACSNVAHTEWFTWNDLPNRSNQVIVSTVIEAFRLFCKGYRKVGVWVQGILPEESYLKHHSRVRMIILNFIEKIVLEKANIIWIVSNEMLTHFDNKYGMNISDKCIIMPCFNTVLSKNSLENKNRYTKKVFCYAGSLAQWQCFEETVKLYSIVESKTSNSELRIYTKETEKANEICRNLAKNYSVASCTNEELQTELQKVTYGFIIRDDNIVNRVATPTKISSYLGNGVIPIYTSSIVDFSKVMKGNIAGCELKNESDWETLLEYVNSEVDYEKIRSGITSVFDKYYNREKYTQESSIKVKKICGYEDNQ